MSIVYRTARLDDFESVFELLQQLWPALQLNEEQTNSVFKRCLESDNDCLLCAEQEGKVVGFGGMVIKNSFWQQSFVGFNKRAFLFSKEIV